VDHLSSQGADVVWRPTVAIEALPLVGSTREALQQIERYQWIVFSSPNGVRQFKEALPAVGCEPSQVHGTIAAIGPATAEELRQAGLKPAVVADDSRAEGLAAALGDRVQPGDRILIVRPQEARELLPAALRSLGGRVDLLPLYRSVAGPDVETVAGEVRKGRYDLVIFASPSALKRLLEPGATEATLEALRSMRVVCIGPVTAAAAEGHGITPSIATEPTDEGVLRAVLRATNR
jgi:uroporphyrinogen-III synthase